MDASAWAAWYAAGVATLVAVWDVYKWASNGPSIRASAYTGMLSTAAEDVGKKFIRVTVTNIGDKPTTLNALGLFVYESKWKRLRHRPSKAWVVNQIFFNRFPLPMPLHTGIEWTGFLLQEDDLVEIAKTEELFVSFEFSHQSKPIVRRLVFRDSKPA